MSGLWKWNKKERYKIICDITEKEFPLNNVHTEGMNRYQHPEFQVILKLPPALIHYLLKELMKKSGRWETVSIRRSGGGFTSPCPDSSGHLSDVRPRGSTSHNSG